MPSQIPSSTPPPDFPSRIVCLSDETVETLYRLGEQDRIVGVSSLTTRPPEVRTKPKVSGFHDAHFDSILGLRPDLVLAFSDVQAEIARQLILRGLNVFCFNQRTIGGIFDMIGVLSRLVGKESEGSALVQELRKGLDEIRQSAEKFPFRPRVFFEEWKEPLVSGIEWVEELVEIAGGEPLFPETRGRPKAKDRIVDPAEVARRDPEVVVASWCGMKVNPRTIRSRPGWAALRAVKNGHLYEIQSSVILQPGPASLTEGARQLHSIFARVAGVEVPPGLKPMDPAEPLGPGI